MTKHVPPIPPAGRSPKGTGTDTPQADPSEAKGRTNRPVPDNLAEQDRQGNIKQNTTHQGYQQDR